MKNWTAECRGVKYEEIKNNLKGSSWKKKGRILKAIDEKFEKM